MAAEVLAATFACRKCYMERAVWQGAPSCVRVRPLSGWAQEVPKKLRDSMLARGSLIGGGVEVFAAGNGGGRESLPFTDDCQDP